MPLSPFSPSSCGRSRVVLWRRGKNPFYCKLSHSSVEKGLFLLPLHLFSYCALSGGDRGGRGGPDRVKSFSIFFCGCWLEEFRRLFLLVRNSFHHRHALLRAKNFCPLIRFEEQRVLFVSAIDVHLCQSELCSCVVPKLFSFGGPHLLLSQFLEKREAFH